MGSTSKNNVMVDCLISANRIRTRPVERVFRAVDRGDYVTPDDRYQAHLQQPWRSGKLHLSAPCIYGEVLEGLELKPGLSFLNVGSGTGYFSTVVGLIIGCSGVNHGVEVYSYVVDYANQRLEQFIESSPALDEFDFCSPKFYCGNGLCLGSVQQPYDRVYCGADCPAEFLPYFKQLIKIGGVLVLPCGNRLLQCKRKSVDTWTTKSLLNVAFATLQLPTSEETAKRFTFEMTCPQRLQILSYAVVRKRMRAAQLSRRPRVFEPLLRCPRLTDVDVNELLRYILSMDRNRENPLPLSGFPSDKRENVRYKDGDHIKPLVSSSKSLEGTNKSDLTLKNDADASRDKNKSPNITQANKELDKMNGVQANKSASLPLIEYLQKPTSDSLKETNKSCLTSKNQSGTILEANKELEKINRGLSNSFPAILGYPNFQLHTSKLTLEGTNKSDLTSKNTADASGNKNKSVNITETKEHLEKIKGLVFGNLQTTSDSLKETNNSGLTTSDDSEKSVNITETNKELEKNMEEVTNNFFSLPLSPDLHLSTKETLEEKQKINFTFSNKGSEKKKKVQSYNFLAPSPNSQLPSLKFSISGITTNKSPEKVIKSGLTQQTADASDSKKQSDENITSQTGKWSENINSSPVFTFSDSENDSSSCSGPSPAKTVSGTPANAWSIKPLNKNINESVKQSTSASPERVSEPNPANELNSKCDQVGKDIRLSILMNQGVMEVHLPYEQKEYTNIIFTKMVDKPMIASEDKSSGRPHNSEPSETHLAKRQDTYKSDILARIQIALSSIPLSKVVPPVTVRISFKTLNFYTEWIWDSMMIAMTQSFDKVNYEHNKAIFQKGALLLAEAKVAYAQTTISQTPNEVFRSLKAFTDEELLNLKEMASKVPLPLAVYLECLGNTNNDEQVITPILAEHPKNMALSGAPHLMVPLLQLLRFGVPLNGPIHQLVLGLGLPMLHWEEFPDTTCGAKEESLMVRITEESYNFWITTRNGSPAIKWDAEDCRTFKQIVLSLDSKKGHNVDFDLSHGVGSQAQLVQTIDYNVDRSTRWFTKVDVDDYSIKLGAAFAFQCPNDDQCTNKFPPSYMSGIITPRRIMFAILCSVYHS